MPFNMDIFNTPTTPAPAPRSKKVSSLTAYRLSPRPAPVTPRFFSAETSHQEQIPNIFRSPLGRPGGKHLKSLVIDPNITSPSQQFGGNSIFSDGYPSRGDLSAKSFVEPSSQNSNLDLGDGYPTGKSHNESPLPIRKPLPLDYYLEPSWEQIRTMTSKDLENVSNFKVGRKDCGWVIFPGKTDIRNVDVAKMVLIKPREVEGKTPSPVTLLTVFPSLSFLSSANTCIIIIF
jgi:hypothetical protein